VPDARVVIIASIAHTLVVERSCQFSVNTNAMTGSAADWVGYILYKNTVPAILPVFQRVNSGGSFNLNTTLYY